MGDLLKDGEDFVGQGEDGASDELLADIDPIGGTLAVFDSPFMLPHEVLATKDRRESKPLLVTSQNDFYG